MPKEQRKKSNRTRFNFQHELIFFSFFKVLCTVYLDIEQVRVGVIV
jgi:hypothetical protein